MNSTIISPIISQLVTPNSIFNDLNFLKQQCPLIHNITNLVVMNITANVLLAINASPFMGHGEEESEDIAQISNALVINMGTLDKQWKEIMLLAQRLAGKRNIPIVFDPVGAGATKYRTETAKHILRLGVDILRGNASEIMSLVDDKIKTKGVDSTQDSLNAIEAAKILSHRFNCIVIISGKIDIIVGSGRQAFISHGTALFTKVVGMGCSITAVIAAFSAVNSDYFLASIHANAVFAIAGEIAASKSLGPGSFAMNFLDSLSNLQLSDFSNLNIKVE